MNSSIKMDKLSKNAIEERGMNELRGGGRTCGWKCLAMIVKAETAIGSFCLLFILLLTP